jgi:hypothetical protein
MIVGVTKVQRINMDSLTRPFVCHRKDNDWREKRPHLARLLALTSPDSYTTFISVKFVQRFVITSSKDYLKKTLFASNNLLCHVIKINFLLSGFSEDWNVCSQNYSKQTWKSPPTPPPLRLLQPIFVLFVFSITFTRLHRIISGQKIAFASSMYIKKDDLSFGFFINAEHWEIIHNVMQIKKAQQKKIFFKHNFG